MKLPLLLICLVACLPVRAADTLAALVQVVAGSSDPQVQLDVLRGLRDATQGAARLPMPAGWEALEPNLVASGNVEIRGLARALGLKFGSEAALQALRTLLRDRAADPVQRQDALRALAGVRDAELPAMLRDLLQDPPVRAAAIRALAGFDDPATGPALLAIYPSLNGAEKRDALSTLASRPAYARALLAAMEAGSIPSKDLNAEAIRQLRNLKDDTVNASLTKVYGAVREVAADKQAEIGRYKRLYAAGGSTPGEAIRGRAVFARVCQQCHTLFDTGGKVGPDLTGSNRGDLDYLLQNILDPNAVIPNEYRASTVEMKDGRVLTGILRPSDDRSVVVATATETVTVSRADVREIQQSQLSMMPEGLLVPLMDQEYRDLVYYLGRPGQAPMLATADTASLFFNGHDLTFWQGDESVWRVEGGEIVGRTKGDRQHEEFLRSDLVAGDFRLVFELKLVPDEAIASVWFRSEPLPDGGMKGFWVGAGFGLWGVFQEAGGRRFAWDNAASLKNPGGEWSTYEILAVGNRIRTVLNGRQGADLEDALGARQGLVAFGLPAPQAELRIRNLRLEMNPKPQLTTLKK